MALFKQTEEITLNVTGMHCPKCVARVKEALEGVDGVVSAEVSLEDEKAVVSGTASADALVAAVEAINFGASVA